VYITDTRAIGGAERYLAVLAEGAAVHGHDTLILAPQDETVDWLADQAPGVHVRRAFGESYHDARTPARRGSELLSIGTAMTRLLRELAPDVVHVNNGGFPGSDLCRVAMAAARLAGVRRRAMTVHSIPSSRPQDGHPLLQRAADGLVWSCANLLISPSDAVATGLRQRRGMPRALARTIYYGVTRAPYDPRAVGALRERLAPAGELLVGMVSARPVPEKGYDVFLDALAVAGDRVRGVVVGPAPRDLASRAESLGVGERLAIEGAHEELGDYYRAFDVLAVPSTAGECMPLVILEAASVGTPAFGSRLAGIPEAIRDGVDGRLFEPGEAGALARHLDAAEHDRATIAGMGSAAEQRWQVEFQIDRMVDSTLALYRADRSSSVIGR
jgi:glycosyltransferase involved in cell wall biosynthesis